jgi:hypothetical protein
VSSPLKTLKPLFAPCVPSSINCPDAEAWIAGPEDEDPDYAADCHSLVKGLGLNRQRQIFRFSAHRRIITKSGIISA